MLNKKYYCSEHSQKNIKKKIILKLFHNKLL